MDNGLMKIYSHDTLGSVRMLEIDGEPWFVLKDVCAAFGETNYRRVSARLDESEKGVSQVQTKGGMQNTTIINESGLYSTLFEMQPQKARGVSAEYIEARQQKLEAFKHWVTHDVLPSIRKYGGYVTPTLANELLNDPDALIDFALSMIDQKKITKENKIIDADTL